MPADIAALHVLGMRHRLQMLGVHTGPIAAEVVEIESFGNFSPIEPVGQPGFGGAEAGESLVVDDIVHISIVAH